MSSDSKLKKLIKESETYTWWWENIEDKLGIDYSSWKRHAVMKFVEDYQENKIPKFCREDWYLNSDYAMKHFVYTSKKIPSKLAFTENDARGIKDVQTTMAVGRYLKRFFGDVLSDAEIKEWANIHRQENSDYVLKFANTPEEITFVYENGPNSCMSGSASNWEFTDGIHPASVYGGPDTAVAYLERDDRITARSVVVHRDNRKEYVSLYGDTEALYEFLKDAEYEEGSLEDCRLLYLVNDRGEVIVPYLDGCCDRVNIKKGGKFPHLLVCDDGDYEASHTNGLLEEIDLCYCNFCDQNYREEDGEYVRSENEWVCNSCIESEFEYALDYKGDEVLSRSDCVVTAEDGTKFQDEDSVEDNDYSWDSKSDGIYPRSKLVEDLNGDLILLNDSILVTDEDEGEYYDHKDNKSDYKKYKGYYYTEEAYRILTEGDDDD